MQFQISLFSRYQHKWADLLKVNVEEYINYPQRFGDVRSIVLPYRSKTVHWETHTYTRKGWKIRTDKNIYPEKKRLKIENLMRVKKIQEKTGRENTLTTDVWE